MNKSKIKIDYRQFKKICLADIPYFKRYGETVNTRDGVYFYQDNGSDILAVAHLDSVQDTKHFYPMTVKGRDYVFNAQLDDRLGAYIILNLLPSLGIKYDILLTEGEEVGLSTAAHFETTKQYKWMFSFDRRGDDVVMYQYETKFAKKKLVKCGFKVGIGSFSDISYLDHLKCGGFNFGCGYDNEHSEWCSMDVDMCLTQVKKFVDFYNRHRDIKFNYTPRPYKKVGAYTRAVGWGDEGYNDRFTYGSAGMSEFYMTHIWDSQKMKYVPREGDSLDKLVKAAVGGAIVKYGEHVDLCEVCGMPAREPDLAMYMGPQMICHVCLPYAAQCAVCSSYGRDTDMIDDVCRDCRADIGGM
jgi:hypothetical protein